MKKFVLAFSILLIALKLSAQIIFVGFDQPICSAPMTNTYTYAHQSYGSTPSSYYTSFTIYRNGVAVKTFVGYPMGGSQHCQDLIFINDSTGFLIKSPMGWEVYATSDYGYTWTYINSAPISSYMAFYPINANCGYLVEGTSGTISVYLIEKWGPHTPFIYDDSVNADIYKTDTIIGNSLCNIDSLNIFVKNSLGDTIDYHINLFYVPLGVNELQQPSSSYTVYPNPAQNTLYIKGDSFSMAEIYNTQGAKIYEGNSKTINVEEFFKGIYFIRIIDHGGKFHDSKFIRE